MLYNIAMPTHFYNGLMNYQIVIDSSSIVPVKSIATMLNSLTYKTEDTIIH